MLTGREPGALLILRQLPEGVIATDPKGFLRIGGVVLLVLGIVGFLGVRIGDVLWFDSGENWAHTVLGIAAILLSYAGAALARWVTIAVGVVALYFGVHGFLLAGAPAPNYFGLANLENPVDNLLHLVVGVWALYAAFARQPASSMATERRP